MRRRLAMRDDQGVAVVMIVLAMPMFILLMVFTIDVGNWFVHKRHLQTQADAAALAGASGFSFPACDVIPDVIDLVIKSRANQYSGVGDGTTKYNDRFPTVGSRLHTVINEPDYFGQTGNPGDPDISPDKSPCRDHFVDVKMTEKDLPWFFGPSIVPNINARARVAFKEIKSLSGILPIGVEEVDPKQAHVYFFDEDTGTKLGDAVLKPRGASGGLVYYDNRAGQAGTAPVSFNVTQRRIGVRIILSGSDSPSLDAATNCAVPPPLAVCYGYGTANALPTNSLARIRGHRTSGPVQTLEDRVASVRLGTGTACSIPPDDGYFHSDCTAVQVAVSMVGLTADQQQAGDLTATITGSNQKVNLTPSTPAGPNMVFTGVLPVVQDVGPHNIGLSLVDGKIGAITCKSGNNNPAECESNNVQRTFAASRSVSGPIKALEVEDADGPTHNVPRCETTETTCTRQFAVSIGLAGRQSLGGVKPVALRVSVKDPALPGNQTKSLQCDPAAGGASGLEDQIATGCAPTYTENPGTACPNKATLFNSMQPWNCVALKTGNSPNSPPRGLNRRILCNPDLGQAGNCGPNGSATVCTQPNKWPNFNVENDPRRVAVFFVPFGSLDGSGADETVPVLGVANFYVTGYTGGGGVNTPCAAISGAGKDEYAENPPDEGTISGRFFVGPNPGGEPSDVNCGFVAVTACTAVLVK